MSPQEYARIRAEKKQDAIDYMDMLSLNEGERRTVYLDSKNKPTIGIGFNLEEPHNKKFLKDKGVDVERILKGEPISRKLMIEMYNHSLTQAFNDAIAYEPDFWKHPKSVQRGLVDMAFNLGLTKLKKFKKMKEGLDARDYDKVTREAIDSDWYKQVKSRGPRTVDLFRQAAQ